LFILSAAANTPGNVLGRLDFLPNLKDSIHDSAMSVNADKHRFTLPSTRRLQYKQVEVPYPWQAPQVDIAQKIISKTKVKEKEECVWKEIPGTDLPGPQSSQHHACHFSPITLFPCQPPPCPHDPCACACQRWWPNVFFCSSSSSCGQSTFRILSLTSAESSLSASSSVTTSQSEMRSRCFRTFRHFPAFDDRPSSRLGD